MLIPWSAFWERNYFVEWSPILSKAIASNYTRGAVTGLGLLNVWAALGELGDLFRPKQPPSNNHPINQQSEISNQRW